MTPTYFNKSLSMYPSLEGVSFHATVCGLDTDCQSENPLLVCEEFGSELGKLCSCNLQVGRYGQNCMENLSGMQLLQPALIGILQLYVTRELLFGTNVLRQSVSRKFKSPDNLALIFAVITLLDVFVVNSILMVNSFTASPKLLSALVNLQMVFLGPSTLSFAVLSVCVLSISWLVVIERNPFEKLNLNVKLLKTMFTVFSFILLIGSPSLMALGMFDVAIAIGTIITIIVTIGYHYIGRKLTRAIAKNSVISPRNSSKKSFSFSKTHSSTTMRNNGSLVVANNSEKLVKVFERLERLTHSLTRRCACLVLALMLVLGMLSVPAGKSKTHASYWVFIPLHLFISVLPASVTKYNYSKLQSNRYSMKSTTVTVEGFEMTSTKGIESDV